MPNPPSHSPQPVQWQAVQVAPGAPAVLAVLECGRHRYAEDARHPEHELVEQLNNQLRNVRVVVTVPCAQITLQTLLQRAPRLQAVLVVDNNPERFQAWQQAVRLPDDRRIQTLKLSTNTATTALAHALGKLCLELFLGNCHVYIPRRFARLDPEFCRWLQAVTLAELQKTASYAVHQSLRSWRGTVNMLCNIQRVGPRQLRLDRPEVPAVTIVGAGPSLDRNVAQLAHYADRTLIIGCDAAVRTLLCHGIKPDILVAHEDCSTCWRFFQQHLAALTDIPLLVPYRISELVVRRYPGPLVLAPTGDEPDWLQPLLPEVPLIPDGSCVGHLAFNLATFFQPRTLIMIGFDLAFPNDQVHCQGMEASYWKEPQQVPNPVMVEGIDGKPVRTDLSFVYYRQHFEQLIADSTVEVVDATEGGARIAGARVAALAPTLAALPARPKPAIQIETLVKKPASDVLADAVRQIQRARELLLKARLRPQQLLDESTHPLWQWLTGQQPPYSLLCNCADFLLRVEFRYAVQHWRKSGESAELLQLLPRLLTDFIDAADLLLEAWQFSKRSAAATARTAVLLLQPTAGEFDAALVLAATGQCPELILPDTSPLPAIWQAIRTHDIGLLVIVDAGVTPVTWVLPDVACLDIKTTFAPTVYERTMWLSGYSLGCSDAAVLRQWQQYVPADVPCRLL